jgi:hypothetical protein
MNRKTSRKNLVSQYADELIPLPGFHGVAGPRGAILAAATANSGDFYAFCLTRQRAVSADDYLAFADAEAFRASVWGA